MIRKKFTVRGMTCSSCSAHVEHSVSQLNGVISVQVNLMGATMHVEYDDDILSEDDIINTVNRQLICRRCKHRIHPSCPIAVLCG